MTFSSRARVLHLGNPTGLYGAEHWIMALTRHLPPDIESVVGVVKDAPGPMPPLCELATAKGLATHVIESQGKLSFSAIPLLRRYIQQHDIDIIHTHGYKTDLIGCLATIGTRCLTVSTPHGWSTDAGFKLQVYEWIDRMVFPFLSAVVPLSSDLHTELRQLPGLKRNLHLIQNGVDLSDVEAAPAIAPELEDIRRSGGFVVGYIGQLIPRKGIDTLIRAFSQLPFENRCLCLLGEGPQRAELEQLAASLDQQNRIRFLGYRKDRLSLLKLFDVFVLPSMLEGIPRCLLEAMAAGVPVAASNIPGCRTLVSEGKTGLLFEVGDQAGLVAQLTRLHADAQLRDVLAQAGKKLVYGEFSAETMARKYAALYRDLLMNRSGKKTASDHAQVRE